jgi:hypothetical protein
MDGLFRSYEVSNGSTYQVDTPHVTKLSGVCKSCSFYSAKNKNFIVFSSFWTFMKNSQRKKGAM